MTSPIIYLAALEPLYLQHKIPSFHGIMTEKEGNPAKTIKGRRPRDIIIAQPARLGCLQCNYDFCCWMEQP